jgi:hypothetical protein
MRSKTFVFGVGAQKAGTSWLHRYIRDDDCYREGPIGEKELHIWDRRDLEIFRNSWRSFRKVRGTESFILTVMERSEHMYFSYFSYVLRNGGIAADITPSYAGLSEERLAKIRDGFDQQGINMKCMFLMRDPVGRCLSAFSMNRLKATDERPREGVRSDIGEREAFREYFKSSHCRLRTEYQETIRRIKSVFPESQAQFIFYEELFDKEVLAEISDFIGVRFRPDLAAKRVNEGKGSYEICNDLIRECALYYEPTYHAVSDAFPAARKLWDGFKYL